MNILGIESSCDETAAAVYSDHGLLSNVIASQSIHRKFGGVVPELASRAHQKTIWSVTDQALNEAGMSINDIDAIAVTHGPGLMGALLVGLSFAKGLSLSHQIPIIGVNHIDAHIYANFIEETPVYPFLALIVSGGHTRLVVVKDFLKHSVLGDTRDDAAGEAFDKTAKILGIEYPGGPRMDKLAQTGDIKFVKFPQALLKDGYEFSFSGLKTSVLYHLEAISEADREQYLTNHLNDLCASISHAITEVLIKKTEKALHEFGLKSLVIAGGVSANSMLRSKMEKLAQKSGVKLSIPKPVYCTDNAAMIAVTGYLKAKSGQFDSLELEPFASMH
ncbi:MAG TPA: tRNA (adenosine(37)-N6)-threonylcarbamoyltransferase complex transferase subunit TsaD [Bacteroidetes bacterium]|nr:tRNA (adenosine(37)-N6)-threonylcarbamoyltransferase complex transferase subunit TsaD [Bacteroidota bacterium]